jgi:hypothetical protein
MTEISKDFLVESWNNRVDTEERERLIELLSGKSIDTIPDVEYVADYLLANGVRLATIPRNRRPQL